MNRFPMVMAGLLSLLLAAAASAADGDGDGVPNQRDLCPNSPAGAAVDAIGCPPRATDTPPPARPARRPARKPAAARTPPVPPAAAEPAAPAPPPTPEQAPVTPQPPPASAAPVFELGESRSVTVYFGLAESRLSGQALQVVQAVAERMNQDPFLFVTIYGYTANSGDMLRDMPLAQARAEDVQRVLVINGVAPDRITVPEVSRYEALENPAGRAERLRAQRALLRFHQGDF